MRPENGARTEGDSVTEAAVDVEKQLQSHFLKFSRLLFYVKLLVERAHVLICLSKAQTMNTQASRSTNEILRNELEYAKTLLRLSAFEDFENYNVIMMSVLNTFRRIHRKLSSDQRKY